MRQYTAMTGSFSLTAASLGSWNENRQPASSTSPALSICQSSLWGSSIHGVSSGHRYRVITDANAAWETERCSLEGTSTASYRVIVPRRLCAGPGALTWHRQLLETLQTINNYNLQLRNVRHLGKNEEKKSWLHNCNEDTDNVLSSGSYNALTIIQSTNG